VKDIPTFHTTQEWHKLNAIYETYPNFTVRFGERQKFFEVDNVLLECIKEIKVPFFLGSFISNFEQLQYTLSLGVAQVYLVEDICFDLVRAKRICSAHNVQIRAFPNIAQSSVKATAPIKKFFIRPEDIDTYQDVIDTIEFWGPEDRQAVLYRIYAIKKAWKSSLDTIILDFDCNFDSTRVLPAFAEARKYCGKRCMKGERCGICESALNISNLLRQNHLVIKH